MNSRQLVAAARTQGVLADAAVGAIGVAMVLAVVVPLLLGRALAREVGLSVSYGAWWLIGAVMLAVVGGPVVTLVVRWRRGR